MADRKKSELKTFNIMDPLLCVRCDHSYIADVIMKSGERKKMFYCARRDCDNRVTPTEQPNE